MVFLTKNSRVAHLWSRTTLVKSQKKLYRKRTFSIESWFTSQLFNEKRMNTTIIKESNNSRIHLFVMWFKPVMIKGGGINASIICIETLFLAEYCGFGWVVGTFFWVFWFFSWSLARRNLMFSPPPLELYELIWWKALFSPFLTNPLRLWRTKNYQLERKSTV